MKISRVIATCLLFTAFLSSFACGEKTGNGNMANLAAESWPVTGRSQKEDNNEELSGLVNFPLEPEDVVWRKSPEGNSLIAVLRFSPADAKKLREQLEAGGNGSARSIPPEDWFPSELLAQSEANPDAGIAGRAFPAFAFYQSPFNDGTVTVVSGTDFFILELRAG